MAEVIGTVASVAQLVQVSGALLVGGYSFLSATVRAPAEIRSLLAEVAAVNSILSQLQQIEEDNHLATRQSSIEALKSLGAFEECQISLKFVQSALGKCQGEAGKDLFNLGRRLKWPFQEKETKEALQRLHRLRSMLMNAVELDAV